MNLAEQYIAHSSKFFLTRPEPLPNSTDLGDGVARMHAWLRKLNPKEPVLIFADYDVDGMLSAVLASFMLGRLGFTSHTFTPDRFKDGYGLKPSTFERAKLHTYTQALILDSGTNQIELLDELAKTRNILVLDHHTPIIPHDRPYLVNPHLCAKIKGTELCTGQIVYLFIESLIRSGETRVLNLFPTALSLATLTTLADQIALTGSNHTFVKTGLKAVPKEQILGPLLLTLSLTPELITEKTLAWKVIPTLNAAGRLGLTDSVFNYFLKPNMESAQALTALNRVRQDLTRQFTIEAQAQIDDAHSINVLFSRNWHIGLVGVLAGQISNQTNKPTIVLGFNNHTSLWEGSMRCPNGFSALEILTYAQSTIETGFGGHAQAAGLKTKTPELLKAQLSKHNPTFSPTQSQTTALPITTLQCTKDEVQSLDQLRPFGNGNPAPLLLIQAKVLELRAVKTGTSGLIADNLGTVRIYLPPELPLPELNKSYAFIGELECVNPYPPSFKIQSFC